MSIEGQGHFLTIWPKVVYIQKLKPDFSQKLTIVPYVNQILYESFQVHGNENLMT